MTSLSSVLSSPLLLSLRVAFCATLLVVLVGAPIALVLARKHFPGKELLNAALLLPLVLPPTVLGYVLLLIFGRRGAVGGLLESFLGVSIAFHWTGAVVASAFAAFPLFLISARSAIEGVDPRLEDVARLLGRRESSVIFDVTLPLAWRGLLAGVLLSFTRALGDFGATLMLAGDLPGRTQTASLAIYDAVQEEAHGRAALLTLAVASISFAVLAASRNLTQKPRFENGLVRKLT